MKYTINTLLVLFLFLPIFSQAQAPGYLGKRASFTLNLSSMPALFQPSQNNKGGNTFGESSGSIGFNYEIEANFSYATGRYRSLDLFLSQYYTGATSSARSSNSIGAASWSNSHDLFLRLNVKSIGLVYNLFKRDKGGLAPVGNTFYFGMKASFVNADIVDIRTYNQSEFSELYGHGNLGIDQKKAYGVLLCGWSNTQIFWDKFILKTGLRFGLVLSSKLSEYTNGTSENYSEFDDDYNQQEFEKQVYLRLLGHEAMRFDVGVGYLLF